MHVKRNETEVISCESPGWGALFHNRLNNPPGCLARGGFWEVGVVCWSGEFVGGDACGGGDTCGGGGAIGGWLPSGFSELFLGNGIPIMRFMFSPFSFD